MFLPHWHADRAEVSWPFSGEEENWVIQELAVLVDAEGFYIHVVSHVSSSWLDRLQVCCTRTALRDA